MTTGDPSTMGLAHAPELEVLSEGLFAFVQLDGSWGLSNAGLAVADDMVVLIDTAFTERRNRALVELIQGITEKPVRILVNTHHHGDHTYGNGWFADATVVSHSRTREAILTLKPESTSRARFPDVEFGSLCPTVPSLTFDDRISLHVGPMTLDVLFTGTAHCPGDTVVHVPERATLFAGDVVLKDCTPTFVGGSVRGYLDVIENLRRMELQRIVPGHGPTCDATVLDEIERYLHFILELADRGAASGIPALELARIADLGEFAGWKDPERIVGNLYRAYQERDGGPAGGPIDWNAMWAETELYLGHPVRSYA